MPCHVMHVGFLSSFSKGFGGRGEEKSICSQEN